MYGHTYACPAGSEVEFCAMTDASHSYPSPLKTGAAACPVPGGGMPAPTGARPATNIIWPFFAQHSL
jgi:poly(3-hydroxybutyrate) depolymerase